MLVGGKTKLKYPVTRSSCCRPGAISPTQHLSASCLGAVAVLILLCIHQAERVCRPVCTSYCLFFVSSSHGNHSKAAPLLETPAHSPSSPAHSAAAGPAAGAQTEPRPAPPSRLLLCSQTSAAAATAASHSGAAAQVALLCCSCCWEPHPSAPVPQHRKPLPR
jgi:hypothetical protein